MGYKIGAPSLKLNNAGTVSKHCGDFGSVAMEALEERKGHDPDIDRDRADLNYYEGFRTAAELMEYSKAHVEQLRDAKGRKLRSDAVVMCGTILKPPAAMMAQLAPADQRRFLNDANEAFAEIVGRENIKSRADHFDEQGSHSHVFWEPMTADGRLCAKEVHNLQFFGRVNRELPQKLRDKGWDIEDCECYDAAKEQYEKAMKQSGRSSMSYKLEAEMKKQELLKDIEHIEDVINEHSGPVENIRRVEGIQERAKASKSLLGRSETVKLDRADFDKLVASAKAGASADSERRILQGDYDRLQYRYEQLQQSYNRKEELIREQKANYEKLREQKEASFFESIPLIGKLFTLLREVRQSWRDEFLKETIKEVEKQIQREKDNIKTLSRSRSR